MALQEHRRRPINVDGCRESKLLPQAMWLPQKTSHATNIKPMTSWGAEPLKVLDQK